MSVAGHVEAELFVDVEVTAGRLVACATGAVETGAGIDARGGDVAVVLPGEGVAGAADRGREFQALHRRRSGESRGR